VAAEYKILRATTIDQVLFKATDWGLATVEAKLKAATLKLPSLVLVSGTMSYDFDLRSVWLTPTRWTKLVNLYLSPQALQRFVRSLERFNRSSVPTSAVLMFKDIGGINETHLAGNCLLSLVLLRGLDGYEVVLHSRVTLLGYTCFVDAALAYVILKQAIAPVLFKLSKRVPVSSSPVRFRWVIDDPNISVGAIWAYILNHRQGKISKDWVGYRRIARVLQLLRQKEVQLKHYTDSQLGGSYRKLQELLDPDELKYFKKGRFRRVFRRYREYRRGLTRFPIQVNGLELPPRYLEVIHEQVCKS